MAELDPAPDHIVIEASGVANPARVRGIISILPKLHVEATVVLAEAVHLRQRAHDKQIGALVRDQLASADLAILNKADLATALELRESMDWLAATYPNVVLLQAAHAELPAELILGAAAGATGGDPHHHNHGPEFSHAWYETARLLDREAFLAALDALPASILRGKGFVRFSDNPKSLEVLQLVGRRCSLGPAERSEKRPPTSRLSFIALAEGFDEAGLLAGLAATEI